MWRMLLPSGPTVESSTLSHQRSLVTGLLGDARGCNVTTSRVGSTGSSTAAGSSTKRREVGEDPPMDVALFLTLAKLCHSDELYRALGLSPVLLREDGHADNNDPPIAAAYCFRSLCCHRRKRSRCSSSSPSDSEGSTSSSGPETPADEDAEDDQRQSMDNEFVRERLYQWLQAEAEREKEKMQAKGKTLEDSRRAGAIQHECESLRSTFTAQVFQYGACTQPFVHSHVAPYSFPRDGIWAAGLLGNLPLLLASIRGSSSPHLGVAMLALLTANRVDEVVLLVNYLKVVDRTDE